MNSRRISGCCFSPSEKREATTGNASAVRRLNHRSSPSSYRYCKALSLDHKGRNWWTVSYGTPYILNIYFFIKGQFICGDKRCTETEGLRSWEASCNCLWSWHCEKLSFSLTECREWRKPARQMCCSSYVRLKHFFCYHTIIFSVY